MMGKQNNHNNNKKKEKKTQIPVERHPTKYLTSALQIGKVIKNKVNPRNCQSRDSPKKTWHYQLNSMVFKGREYAHYVLHVISIFYTRNEGA